MLRYELTEGPWETVAGPRETDLAVCAPAGGEIIAEVVNSSVSDRNVLAAAWSYHMAACQVLPWLTSLLSKGVLPKDATPAVQSLLDAYNRAMSQGDYRTPEG